MWPPLRASNWQYFCTYVITEDNRLNDWLWIVVQCKITTLKLLCRDWYKLCSSKMRRYILFNPLVRPILTFAYKQWFAKRSFLAQLNRKHCHIFMLFVKRYCSSYPDNLCWTVKKEKLSHCVWWDSLKQPPVYRNYSTTLTICSIYEVWMLYFNRLIFCIM